MANVLLVRHGSIDGMQERLLGRTDIGLNNQGRVEAARAADACRRLGIRRVVSSPRRRTQETAAIIAAVVDCPIEIVEAFDEIDYGEWTGRLFSELVVDPQWRRFNDVRDDAHIPGGERLEDVSVRIRRGLDRIAQAETGEVVVVTHAEIIRGALLLAESRTWSAWSRYQPEPASITSLRWTRNQESGVRIQESGIRPLPG